MRILAAIRRLVRRRTATERDLFTPAQLAFWEMISFETYYEGDAA
jgi:hypothetical protein